MTVDLSALVSARLCHDLISPMGAIGNGLELMQLSQPAASAELDLIADSLGSAIAKLRFFRIAFGPADAQALIAGEEIRSVTDAMFPGRFTVFWAGPSRDVSRATGKLIFLALLCLEKSLPMGGAATIALAEGDDTIAIAAEGRRLAPRRSSGRWPPGLRPRPCVRTPCSSRCWAARWPPRGWRSRPGSRSRAPRSG